MPSKILPKVLQTLEKHGGGNRSCVVSDIFVLSSLSFSMTWAHLTFPQKRQRQQAKISAKKCSPSRFDNPICPTKLNQKMLIRHYGGINSWCVSPATML